MSNPILKEMAAFTLKHEADIAAGRFLLQETFRYLHKRYPSKDAQSEPVKSDG